jgi:tetratricopeptide (TPR) repeat protein
MYHTLLKIILMIQILFPMVVFAETDTSSLTRAEQKVLYEAQEAINAKDFQKACRMLAEHLRNYPDKADPLVFYALGNAWYLSGNPDKAYEVYEQGFARWPSSHLLCTNFAAISYELKKYRKAGELFEKAYQISKTSREEMLYQSGTAYYQAKDFEKAKSVLLRLSRSGTKKSWVQLLIHVCIEQKDWKEAENSLLKFLNQTPGDTEYWKLLSQVRLRRKDYQGAVSALEIIYGMAPPTRKELEELAGLYLHLNFPLKAVRCLEKAYGPSPTPKQCDEISQIYIQAGRADQSLRYLDMAIKQEDSPARLLEKGKRCYEWGRWDEAIAALQACIQKNPHEAIAHLLLGHCAMEKEAFAFARKAFVSASKGKEYRHQALNALKVLDAFNTESVVGCGRDLGCGL